MLWENLGDIKILIIENDPFNCFLIKSLFRKIPKISFLEVRDGVKALEILKKYFVDIVLLDGYMLNMDGHEILLAIKKQKMLDDIAILVMTTNEMEEKRFYREGTDSFISKPFRLEDLESKIYYSIKKKRSNFSRLIVTPVTNSLDFISSTKKIQTYDSHAIENAQKVFFTKLIYLKTEDNPVDRNKINVIAHIAKVFSLKMGYSNQVSENIFYATLIRDIGLIGVCKVLDCESTFTKEDKSIYQEYILLGYKMLESEIETEFMRIAKKVILEYNEDYDGSGTPYGLSEDRISNEAMIVSISETFHGLLEDKAYRKRVAFSPQEAYNILLHERNSKFNPQLLEIFLMHYQEFIELRDNLLYKEV